MKHLESVIQRQIVKVVRLQYPNSKIYSVPNGGFRRKVEAAIMKAEGVEVGVSDLHFIHKGKIYFIEVKSEGGRQTDSQKQFEKFVTEQGFKYWLVRSAEEVLKLIDTIK